MLGLAYPLLAIGKELLSPTEAERSDRLPGMPLEERSGMLRAYSLLLLTIVYTSGIHAELAGPIDPTAAVYKIRVKRDGQVADGSAVLVAPGRLLTACHVIRSAQSIRVGREETQ